MEFVIPFLCGALLALTLPRPGLCPLAWIALAPFFYQLWERGKSRSYFSRKTDDWSAGLKHAALLGLLFGAGFYGVTTHWIYSTCRFAGTPILVGLLAWAALTAVLSLNWILFAPLTAAAIRRFPAAAAPWLFALLWTCVEFALDRWTPGIGIVPLEYTQWKYLSWIQAASLIGPHGLGFLIVLWNAALACAYSDAKLRGKISQEAIKNVGIAAILVTIWWGYGIGSLRTRDARPSSQQDGAIAILQPNIDQYQKWDEHYADRIRRNFDRLLGQARRSHPQLVVWPESALPGWMDEPKNLQWVADWARRLKAYLVVGALTRSSSGDHNSEVLINSEGQVAGQYDKRKLVPYGEFVPLRFIFARFIGILNEMADLSAGDLRQPHLATPIGMIGATICFEALFPSLNRVPVASGAEMLVNVTNDGWYKDTWGPYQHFYSNRFRAVENRVPVIRAANTGISAVIDSYGRVVAQLEIGKRGVLETKLPTNLFLGGSFYARHGDWFGFLVLALSIGLVLWRVLI